MPQNNAYAVDCTILTSENEVVAIECEWRELDACAGKGIFTNYDWFIIWWRTLGNAHGRTLHVVIARDNGRLVGVLPLCVIPKKGFRVLHAIGAEAFYFCDAVCEESSQADLLWQMAKQSPHYDFAHIRDVVPDSISQKSLSHFATLRDRAKTFSLKLEWKNSEEWNAMLSENLRKNNAKALRQLSQKGVVSYELCESLPINGSIIEAMVKYKSAWCNEKGLLGMFDQPNILEYYMRMAEYAAQGKTLLLAWIKCGNSVIAQHIMFKHQKTLHSYVMATDPAWNKYSPGNLAHMKAISWAIDNGFKLFDHMQGEFAYKTKFSNQTRECPEYSFHRSFKGWIGEMLFFKRRQIWRHKLNHT